MGRHERVAELARLDVEGLVVADVGCGSGRTVRALLDPPPGGHAPRLVHALDHVSALDDDLLADARVRSRITDLDGPLPWRDGELDRLVSLNTAEHLGDPVAHLAEVHRVLRPGGRLVVTVPHRHVFTWLDPDAAKFRAPRLHRWVYSARFGAATYHRRFVDTSDGLRGDIAANRSGHRNYRTSELTTLLVDAGFVVEDVAGANLFWRWFQLPALFAGPRVRRALGRLVALDGRLFTSPRVAANLFVTARRLP